MKQIIPFKKELLFNTKVSEITAISLEHTLSLKSEDLISGEFYITGDYKMTEASINREKFAFKLPFDIALDSRYDMSSLVIDIDNFYYEIINNEALQVNIDIYVEGKKQEEPLPVEKPSPEPPVVIDEEEELTETLDRNSSTTQENGLQEASRLEEKNSPLQATTVEESPTKSTPPMEVQQPISQHYQPSSSSTIETTIPDYASSTQTDVSRKEGSSASTSEKFPPASLEIENEKKVTINKNEFNIFENIDNSDTYVTYHVYIVKENDTIDKILEKYGTTKEELIPYNNLEEVKTGTKLIIPNTNE